MKRIFQIENGSRNIHLALLVGRVALGAMMLTHGLPKMLSLFSGEPVQFASVFGMSAELSLILAVFAEVICALLIIFGLGTRLAVLPLIITMAVAVFIIHAADPFGKQEMGLLYLLGYVMLLFGGSGKYSLDYVLQRKQIKRPLEVARAFKTEDPTLSIYQ